MSLEIFKKRGRLAFCYLALMLAAVCTPALVRAQSSGEQDAASDGGDNVVEIVRQLSSADALKRQRAAEELARLEATDQRRVVEGYRLEEKNSRVRLALDWALYRMGKSEALFAIVRDLDSSRFRQADSYLKMLDEPAPLYLFLERVNGNTQIKLLEILAKIGNAETLERIKPYSESFDPKIAEAAREASKKIEQRLGDAPSEKSTRPRQVEKESSP
jgi:hypothetical protein